MIEAKDRRDQLSTSTLAIQKKLKNLEKRFQERKAEKDKPSHEKIQG